MKDIYNKNRQANDESTNSKVAHKTIHNDQCHIHTKDEQSIQE